MIFLALVTTFGFAMYSCKKPSNDPKITLDTNLVKSAEKYAELMTKRNAGVGDFSIEDIQRNANILTIHIKGGCEAADFQIVWDGSILLSHPGQVNLVLNNESESDCGSEKRFDIQVNLAKIVNGHDPNDFIFHVANGSIKQDKSLNPNGSVTTR